MDTKECIVSRRSIRQYDYNRKIEEDVLREIVNIGAMAPSSKNAQPWRFKIITDQELIIAITKQTTHYIWARKATGLVLVFLNKQNHFDCTKDAQAIGAAIQNMLLYAHSIGVGSCWIGDILRNSQNVKEIVGMKSSSMELMAIVVFGFAKHTLVPYSRNSLEEILI